MPFLFKIGKKNINKIDAKKSINKSNVDSKSKSSENSSYLNSTPMGEDSTEIKIYYNKEQKEKTKEKEKEKIKIKERSKII